MCAICPPATRSGAAADRKHAYPAGQAAALRGASNVARAVRTRTQGADGGWRPRRSPRGDHGALDHIERPLSAHLRPGDRVAVEDPAGLTCLVLCRAGFSARPHGGRRQVRWFDMSRALQRGVRAVVVTTRARNPTALRCPRTVPTRFVRCSRTDRRRLARRGRPAHASPCSAARARRIDQPAGLSSSRPGIRPRPADRRARRRPPHRRPVPDDSDSDRAGSAPCCRTSPSACRRMTRRHA